MERFWNKVIKTSGCWYWIGGLRGRTGYGSIKYSGLVYDVHRFVWFLTYGIFPKSCVLHNCDNRRCVNPKHLRIGTRKDNHVDMVMRHRRASFSGEHNGNAKLSRETVKNIMDEYSPRKMSFRKLAKKYDVNHKTIFNIVHRNAWKDL